MIFWSLTDVERAIRASWGADTCAPEDIAAWHPDNPARGQCGTTALVLNDLFGGGEPVSRPTGKTRLDAEYETLRKRVLTYLRC